MSEHFSGFHPANPNSKKIIKMGIEVLNTVNGMNFPLEALVFGGSYAKGVINPNDDLDVDFYYKSCEIERFVNFVQAISIRAFADVNIDLHIRAHIERGGLGIAVSRSNPFDPQLARTKFGFPNYLSGIHPNSPYIASSREAIKFWQLVQS